MSTLNIAIVGCGSIALQNHLPGLALCPEVKVVALCDSDAVVLEKARQQTGVSITSTRHEEIVNREEHKNPIWHHFDFFTTTVRVLRARL